MATQTTARAPRRHFMGPLAETVWRSGVAIAYSEIDEHVASALEAIPRQPSGEHSVLAGRAALARVAERETAECVAFARRNDMSWSWIAAQLGISAVDAERRYARIPRPPIGVFIQDHGPECGDIPRERLTDDWKAWTCACGAVESQGGRRLRRGH